MQSQTRSGANSYSEPEQALRRPWTPLLLPRRQPRTLLPGAPGMQKHNRAFLQPANPCKRLGQQKFQRESGLRGSRLVEDITDIPITSAEGQCTSSLTLMLRFSFTTE